MRYKNGMLEYSGKLVSYAQHLEDVILFGYFYNKKDPGFYVDVGANHPKHDSVTKFFSLRDWRGINIEPQQHLCNLLASDRPKDITLAVGVSDESSTATLRQYERDGHSTFSKSLQEGYLANEVGYKDIKLELQKLSTILDEYAKDTQIDFMKVDVEGYEHKALKGNNWKKHRPSVLCIEATGTDKGWQAVLARAKYQLHIKDALNEYYVAAEHGYLVDNYHAKVASEVIRYDIAELGIMRAHRTVKIAAKQLKNLSKGSE